MKSEVREERSTKGEVGEEKTGDMGANVRGAIMRVAWWMVMMACGAGMVGCQRGAKTPAPAAGQSAIVLQETAATQPGELVYYDDPARDIHILYPAGWVVRVEDTAEAHQVHLSPTNERLNVQAAKTRITVVQYHDLVRRRGVDFSGAMRAHEALNQNLIQSTDGVAQLLESTRLEWEKPVYLAEFFMHRTGRHPLRMLVLRRFSPQTMSEVYLEAPVNEYAGIKDQFRAIAEDPEIRF